MGRSAPYGQVRSLALGRNVRFIDRLDALKMAQQSVTQPQPEAQEENEIAGKLLVRKGGLEPPRFYPPDPKSLCEMLKHQYLRGCDAHH